METKEYLNKIHEDITFSKTYHKRLEEIIIPKKKKYTNFLKKILSFISIILITFSLFQLNVAEEVVFPIGVVVIVLFTLILFPFSECAMSNLRSYGLPLNKKEKELLIFNKESLILSEINTERKDVLIEDFKKLNEHSKKYLSYDEEESSFEIYGYLKRLIQEENLSNLLLLDLNKNIKEFEEDLTNKEKKELIRTYQEEILRIYDSSFEEDFPEEIFSEIEEVLEKIKILDDYYQEKIALSLIKNYLMKVKREDFFNEKEKIIEKFKSNGSLLIQSKVFELIKQKLNEYKKEDNVEEEIKKHLKEMRDTDKDYEILNEIKSKNLIINKI